MNPTLRAVLSRYPNPARPTAEPVALGNAGGFSGARIWKFEAIRGTLGLRAWPLEGPDLAGLSRIHQWLSQASDLGFVPLPVATLDGSSIVEVDGLRWELTPWMPGQADLARPPALERVQAMFRGLASFHSKLSRETLEAVSPGLLGRFHDLQRLLVAEFDAIEHAIARDPRDPRAILTRQWIDRVRPLAPRLLGPLRDVAMRPVRLQPCLRDARPDHFLFEDHRLTGLIDFGAMGLDTVSGDLARLMVEALGDHRLFRREALAAYEAVRPLEPIEVSLIDRFEQANALLGAGRWARWHFLERRTFDDPRAVEQGLRRGLERIDEARPILVEKLGVVR